VSSGRRGGCHSGTGLPLGGWHTGNIKTLFYLLLGRVNAANVRKHGVSFDPARTVFNDPRLLTIADPEHSDAEEC
jgi:hypothetical protein